ncbi:hypothetical protein [Ruminococcus sp.]|uniref:hypothetical protein n=1 Tax=Ruminococcus sp. TaxID=41978 RepID=UPI0025CF88D9|nr:hypothetical protein [Ruminococcus sp.]MBO4523663.1 hypothetical protein [Ruminococcus sp.]
MEKEKRFSILKFVIIALSIILIVLSIIINIAFSGEKTPKLFGRYVYVVKETDNMGDSVTEGAALLAADAKNETISKGDIVLCYPADSPDTLKVLSIFDIVTAEDGTQKYVTADATKVGSEESITKDKILAKCTGYNQSLGIGSFIKFASGIKGIFALLVLPCVLLVIFFIAKIASSKGEEDEDFGFYEYDEQEKERAVSESRKNLHEKNTNPLFEPSQEIQPSNELERKKMSIAENFSQKKVNPDSPYQKEKERTMQFKAQRSAESTFAAKNVGGSSSTAPTADALREEMLRKTAEAERERTGSFSVKAANASSAVSTNTAQRPAVSEPITDNTGILSKSQLAEMSRNDVPKTTPLRSQSAPSTAAPKPKKSSTPDISDIIDKSERNERKKSPSNMSVDDLIKMIEEEKKKL